MRQHWSTSGHWRARASRGGFALVGAVGLIAAPVLAGSAPALPAAGVPAVLRVGTYHGVPGEYTSIQAAVNAARPGDWILIGPGDYKEHGAQSPTGRPDLVAGVLITTPGLRLRGMNRDTVIVDGTRPGTPACSNQAAAQEFGPPGSAAAGALGLNGIVVYKAPDVWVQNLTACNYLGGSGDTGNEIWWNGGDGSGRVGGWNFSGSYLTATSTFYGGEATAARYGIFSSNWSGGEWNHTYASNFNDSGYYIGACQQVCNQVVDHAWAEFNALGYSGSNSGGQLVVKNSQFDNNEDGFDTNSQNGDNPPPQNGDCPNGGISPITHTRSCWVFLDNYVHDNNNPDVPAAGSAAAGPVGTGMSLSGARNDTVMNNVFANNGAWGTILVPYPDSGPPCTGGTLTPAACLFDENGDAVLNNTFNHNGFFGNPTNGDIGAANLEPGPTDCFRGNTETGGGAVTTSPPDLQLLYPTCTGATVPPDTNPPFVAEVACDSQAISIGPVPGGALCLPGANYPRLTSVVMHPLPANLATMPDPCAGVPVNPWCPGLQAAGSLAATSSASAATSSASAAGGTAAASAAAPAPAVATSAPTLALTGANPALDWLGLSLLVGAAPVGWVRRRRRSGG